MKARRSGRPVDDGQAMPQISAQEFRRLALRVHEVLAGVPLHDVWAVDLPRLRSGISLAEFLATAGTRPSHHRQSSAHS